MPEPSTQRDLRLDFFRGLSLILIFIDHIPSNVLSYFTLQSNTFFDAAEVFIFISGYTAALVYGRRLAAKGAIYATAQVWRRAWTLYVAHIFLFVLFIAEVSYTAATFQNPMYNDEMRVADFLDEPHVAIVQALLLRFQPAFLDILPMYIVLLLMFPAVLLGLRRHWLLVLAPSAALYLAVADFRSFGARLSRRGTTGISTRSPGNSCSSRERFWPISTRKATTLRGCCGWCSRSPR